MTFRELSSKFHIDFLKASNIFLSSRDLYADSPSQTEEGRPLLHPLLHKTNIFHLPSSVLSSFFHFRANDQSLFWPLNDLLAFIEALLQGTEGPVRKKSFLYQSTYKPNNCTKVQAEKG